MRSFAISLVEYLNSGLSDLPIPGGFQYNAHMGEICTYLYYQRSGKSAFLHYRAQNAKSVFAMLTTDLERLSRTPTSLLTFTEPRPIIHFKLSVHVILVGQMSP
jgi:hypothetical protein